MPAPGDAATRGTVFVIAGPTAVGKGTIVSALRQRYPQVWVSVSATTRSPRPGEIPGAHYLFVSDAEFDALIAQDGLLEWATVHDLARYGTPLAPVLEAVAAGHCVVLEIDLQGARQVRGRLPGARLIFIMPPSWDELVRRLDSRGTEDAAERARRLRTAREEMLAFDDFDDVVVNGDVDVAVTKVAEILGLGEPVG